MRTPRQQRKKSRKQTRQQRTTPSAADDALTPQTPGGKRTNLSRTPLVDITASQPANEARNIFRSRLDNVITEELEASPPSSPLSSSGQQSAPVLLSPFMKHECLKQLFAFAEMDESIQKQWWALPTIVSKINRLNQLSHSTQLVPGVSKETTYTARTILERLWKDCPSLLAQHQRDFGHTTKQVFLRTFKIDNKNSCAIYIYRSFHRGKERTLHQYCKSSRLVSRTVPAAPLFDQFGSSSSISSDKSVALYRT